MNMDEKEGGMKERQLDRQGDGRPGAEGASSPGFDRLNLPLNARNDIGCRIDSAGRYGRTGFEKENAMTAKTRRSIGLILVILGIAFLLLNALDYVMRWNQMDSSVSAIGLMLAVIGSGFLRRARESKAEGKG